MYRRQGPTIAGMYGPDGRPRVPGAPAAGGARGVRPQPRDNRRGASGMAQTIAGIDPRANAQAAAGPTAPTAPPGDSFHGDYTGDGYLEDLYKQRMAGTDQYYNRVLERGTESLNNQFAARGGYNSGAALRAIGDYQANVNAQDFRDRSSLAAAASGEQRNRQLDQWNMLSGLAGQHVNTFNPYFQGGAGAVDNAFNTSTQLRLDRAGANAQANTNAFGNNMSMLNTGFQLSRMPWGGGGGGTNTSGGMSSPSQAYGQSYSGNPYMNRNYSGALRYGDNLMKPTF